MSSTNTRAKISFLIRSSMALLDDRVSAIGLIACANEARRLNQVGLAERAAERILSLPGDETIAAQGRFFRAYARFKNGRLDEGRQDLLDLLYYQAPGLKGRISYDLGAISFLEGDLDEAERNYFRAASESRAAENWLQLGWSLRSLAICQGQRGNSRAAIEGLASLLPLATSLIGSQPQLYYDCFNALAIELFALGRQREALAAVRMATGSPLGHLFPEWQRTESEVTAAEAVPSQSATIEIIAPAPSEPESAELRSPILPSPEPATVPAVAWSLSDILLESHGLTRRVRPPPTVQQMELIAQGTTFLVVVFSGFGAPGGTHLNFSFASSLILCYILLDPAQG